MSEILWGLSAAPAAYNVLCSLRRLVVQMAALAAVQRCGNYVHWRSREYFFDISASILA